MVYYNKDWTALSIISVVCIIIVYVGHPDSASIVQSEDGYAENNVSEKRSLQETQETQQTTVEKIEKLEYLVGKTTRTVVKLQSDLEQRVRFEGNSGVMEVRSYDAGMYPFHQPGVANRGMLNIHDHANNYITAGMGEFSAALNGVPFTTRHNDYKLVKPVQGTGEEFFHKTEPLEFPPVPPSVTSKATIAEQAQEMQEYFKAWQNQDDSEATGRDYKNYFKAALCYLEGAWIISGEDIEDWDSDRHFIDAANWESLNGKTRFLFNSGRKNNLENLPWMPTAFRAIDEDLNAELANFEYRIACHPLKDDLPLNRFKLVDRLSMRMQSNNQAYSLEDWELRRTALFQLNSINSDKWYDAPGSFQFIDYLMEQIPGKDNYDGDLVDSVDGDTTLHYNAKSGDPPLNTAYYSRFYSLANADAMGRSKRRRGFNDFSMWAAQTSQSKVSGLSFTPDDNDVVVHQKWSYAIPLEIIYLTPLNEWDPYNLGLEVYTKQSTADADGRDGSSPEKAYDGINTKLFFRTPKEFYEEGGDAEGDAADTSGGVTYVEDKEGNIHQTRASGIYTLMPKIPGIERNVRLRYPIPPLHFDKQSGLREFKAFEKLFNGGHYNGNEQEEPAVQIPELFTSRSSSGDPHRHEIVLNEAQLDMLKNDGSVEVQTEQASGHTHTLVLRKDASDDFVLYQCDSLPVEDPCADGHSDVCTDESSC